MTKLMGAVCVAIAAAAAIGGCGAIMHGGHQQVVFETSPAGATVTVVDALGMSNGSCETPCSLDLKRKKEYRVTISKPGFSSVDMEIDRKTDGWIWGNILLGGIIGLVVDFTSGSAYRLSPKEVNVTLSPTSTGGITPSTDGPTLVILDYAKLSAAEKERLRQFKSIPLSEL